MNIALIGVPGSGKSGLAHQLYKEDTLGSVEIIDNYTEEVTDKSHLALNIYAGYIGNLLVASERASREIGARKDPEPRDTTIVCGTLVETATYQSIHGAMLGQDQDLHKTAIFMNLLGALFQDLFVYDHIFYLPYEGEDSDSQDIDKELRNAISQFGIPYVTLDGQAKLAKALEIIEIPTTTE